MWSASSINNWRVAPMRLASRLAQSRKAALSSEPLITSTGKSSCRWVDAAAALVDTDFFVRQRYPQ